MRQVTGWWLSVALALASATTANAEFVLKAKPPASAANAASSEPSSCVAGVEEVGDRPALRSLLTHGVDKDASFALRSIMPVREAWQIEIDENLGVVSWDGGKPWPDIAADITTRAPVCVRIDWTAKRLVARKAATPAPAPPPADAKRSTEAVTPPLAAARASRPSPPVGHEARAVSSTSRTPGEALDATTASRAAPVAAPPASPVPRVRFALREGETLRQTLERWSKDARWKLVWDARMDYPISVSMTFPPSVTYREAVAEVLRSYWHLPYALEGRMYQNNVLEIVGRTR